MAAILSRPCISEKLQYGSCDTFTQSAHICDSHYCSYKCSNNDFLTSPIVGSDSKIHGVNKGPIWDRQGPGGSHVGPMNFAIWGNTFCWAYGIWQFPVIKVCCCYFGHISINFRILIILILIILVLIVFIAFFLLWFFSVWFLFLFLLIL